MNTTLLFMGQRTVPCPFSVLGGAKIRAVFVHVKKTTCYAGGATDSFSVLTNKTSYC
jgi:hypothetical protein